MEVAICLTEPLKNDDVALLFIFNSSVGRRKNTKSTLVVYPSVLERASTVIFYTILSLAPSFIMISLVTSAPDACLADELPTTL